MLIDLLNYVLVKQCEKGDKISELSLKTKMQPIFSNFNQNNDKIEAIKLHRDNHVLTLKAK